MRDLDAAAASFRALGFKLTPRGYHSIGSQNHCIMFGATYIELLAAPSPHPWLDYHREFLERGEGLAAVALATDDADMAYRELTRRGVTAKAPMDLSRPVEGGMARFRLVQIETTPTVFICQHLTRELVWRPELQNPGELTGVTMAAPRPIEGLPPSIEWNGAPTLRLRGKGKTVRAHGVRLAFS